MRDDATASHPANTTGRGRSAQLVSVRRIVGLLAMLVILGAAFEYCSIEVQAAGDGSSRMILAQNEASPKRNGSVRLHMFATSAGGLVDALAVPNAAERAPADRVPEPATVETVAPIQSGDRGGRDPQRSSGPSEQIERDIATGSDRAPAEAPQETRSAGAGRDGSLGGSAAASLAETTAAGDEHVPSVPADARGSEVAATAGERSAERSARGVAAGGPAPAAGVVQRPIAQVRPRGKPTPVQGGGYPVDSKRDQWESVFGDDP